MKRTYLAILTAILGGALSPFSPPLGRAGTVQAASDFGSQPVLKEQLAVLARPVGESDWSLLVLEQLQAAPLCWQRREDGLIDPALNRFDFAGICSRYLDSNGYSLRTAGEDQSNRYRLRLRQIGEDLELLAVAGDDPANSLLIGRGTIPQRDREAFVPLNLEEGWTLERRTYGSTALNHLYFAHPTTLTALLQSAHGSTLPALAMPPPPPAEQPEAPRGLSSLASIGPVPLAVVPYRGD